MGVPGFARMALGSQFGRIGETMAQVAMVLFVLGHYHSPTLAGLTAFLAFLAFFPRPPDRSSRGGAPGPARTDPAG